MTKKRILTTVSIAYALFAVADSASARDWNIVIRTNDQAGANWNAHTIRDHVGKSDAELRARVQREGIECASSYWYEWDASYYTNRALEAEDAMRARFGYASLDQTLAGMRDGQQIILRQFNFTVDPAWFYGIYSKRAGTVYSANGIRVVIKRVPSYVTSSRVIVETSFPDIDPLYNSICLPSGVQ